MPRLTEPSDVLAQHLRKCEQGQKTSRLLTPTTPKKRVRLQRACHQCARSKSKCDFQHPCARCTRRSVNCIYKWEREHEEFDDFHKTVDQVPPATVNQVTTVSSKDSSYAYTPEYESTEASEILPGSFSDLGFAEMFADSQLAEEPLQQIPPVTMALSADDEIHDIQQLLDQQSMPGSDEEIISIPSDFFGLQDSASDLFGLPLFSNKSGPFETEDHPMKQVMTCRGAFLLNVPFANGRRALNEYRSWRVSASLATNRIPGLFARANRSSGKEI